MITKREFYIDGQWVAPLEARDCAVIDPSTEEICAVISLGSVADTDRAVAAAKAAFPGWAATDPLKRRRVVEGILEQYLLRKEEMARAISLEMGAPIDMARDSQAECLPWHLKNFLTAFDHVEWVRPLGPHAPDTKIALEPIGVVGLITPWNWPMNQVTLKVIPALLAGCTCVLKPSEEAPLSSLLFAEFCHDAGVPAGVFNLVHGTGAGVGPTLTGHPEVDMVSFTGSTAAGIVVSKTAAETVKRVALELGGKSPNLVFDDDGLEAAVARGVRHCFNNTGQSCNAPTRMLVQASGYDRAVAAAREVAATVKLGDPAQPGAHLGPVVNKAQFDKIQRLIQAGIDEGATLVTGGVGRPADLNRGWFVRPTVFGDVVNAMTISKEEIFGPVLAIQPYDSIEDAIAQANDTVYGLAAYIAGPVEDAKPGARKLRAGTVNLNYPDWDTSAPFGGYKQSGNGREYADWGIHDFCEVKGIVGYGD